ncbi:hypothetical protein OG225_18040 [Nocardia sp. NBC_01377]
MLVDRFDAIRVEMTAPSEEVIGVAAYPSLPVRLWRTAPWQANSLMRMSDRTQWVIGLFAVAMVLIAVPLAGAVGTMQYAASADRIHVENARKTPVKAMVTAEPERTLPATYRYGADDVQFEAEVQWSRSGHTATATADVPGGTRRGDDVTIWLGADGEPTTAPAGADDAAGDGVGVGLAVLMAFWSGALVLVWGTGRLFDAHRAACWARDWDRFGRQKKYLP